jgi:predicted amidophosphoribosyltransferase
MENISYCRYRTTPGGWTGDQFISQGIVKAIKGEPFRGYRQISVGGYIRNLQAGNQTLAINWFAERVVEETDFDDGLYSLVPIPDRNKTPTATHVSRTLLLAQALVARLPQQFDIWDHLRFRRPMIEKTRNENLLYTNMICTSDRPPAGFVILLDDVCTTGSHVLAARRRLRECGAQDICSMSVARTMSVTDEQVFGFREDTVHSTPTIIFKRPS